MKSIVKRKKEHIELAFRAVIPAHLQDGRFYYEPLLAAMPSRDDFTSLKSTFLGQSIGAPLWISSITGGGQQSGLINQRLAMVASEFGLPMALGSCRVLLSSRSSKKIWKDFTLRTILGPKLPFFANLGIAQIQSILAQNNVAQLEDLVGRLEADGLVIHINPLQEWFQPEGDVISTPPLESIAHLLSRTKTPLIIKEVGQGMGPASLQALISMPVAAIEFAALGGTNFTQLELLRQGEEDINPWSKVGHNIDEMIAWAIQIKGQLKKKALCTNFIVAGGVRGPLDGHWALQRLGRGSLYGHARAFLQHAMVSHQALRQFVLDELNGLLLAQSFLQSKSRGKL